MKFRVIDLQTGRPPNLEKIALEDWIHDLTHCDLEGFAICEDDILILLDQYAPWEISAECMTCGWQGAHLLRKGDEPPKETVCQRCGEPARVYMTAGDLYRRGPMPGTKLTEHEEDWYGQRCLSCGEPVPHECTCHKCSLLSGTTLDEPVKSDDNTLERISNKRRVDLIYKQEAGPLSPEEKAELENLQLMADERICPLMAPILENLEEILESLAKDCTMLSMRRRSDD